MQYRYNPDKNQIEFKAKRGLWRWSEYNRTVGDDREGYVREVLATILGVEIIPYKET